MNAKTAKLIRRAAAYRPRAGTEYAPLELHRVLRMPAFETHIRTIREMGPRSPGAPTNTRRELAFIVRSAVNGQIGHREYRWVPRTGARASVVSKEVEKIRYLPDGKTPAKALMVKSDLEGARPDDMMPKYHLIPCAKPIRLKPACAKRVYRELKYLERIVGLEAIYRKLEAEAAA